MKLADNLKTLPSRVVAYTKPRSTSSGDSPIGIPNAAAISGGVQGYLASGLTLAGAGAGAVGGFVGVKAGEATNSLTVALAAGAATGAAATVGLPLGMTSLVHPQLVNFGAGTLIVAGAGALAGAAVALAKSSDQEGAQRIGSVAKGAALGAGTIAIADGLWQVAQATSPAHLLAPALTGALVGVVGTLAGDRKAAVRDGVFGGMVVGGAAALLTHNPMIMLAGGAAAGLAGRFPKPLAKIGLGAVIGAAAGATGGVHGIVAGAITGAVVTPLGDALGVPFRQAMRNATEDSSNWLGNKLDPFIQAHPLGHKGKLALGAAMGVLMLGPVGLVGGLHGVEILGAAGAIGGALKVEGILRQRVKDADKVEFLEAANKIALGAPLDLATLAPPPRKALQSPVPQARADGLSMQWKTDSEGKLTAGWTSA